MLPKQIILLSCTFLFVLTGFAQRHGTVDRSSTSPVTVIDSRTLENLPFSRNINVLTIKQNVSEVRIRPINGDGHTNTFAIDADYNRIVTDHIGVGAEIDVSSIKTVTGSNYSKSSNWMAYGDVLYGTSFGGNINLYGKAAVGFGQSKASTNNTTSPKGNQFGYKIEVGAPFHMFKDGGNYITPFINYSYLREKSSGTSYTTNQFNLGFMFQNYSYCSSYQCDCHHERIFSRNAYDPGRSFINYSSMGNFGFGKSKYEYGNFSDKNNITDGLLSLEYGYYFIPNFAIGAGVSWNGSSEGSGNSKYTSSELIFTPMITVNAPADNCLNNLFIQGGYGFGYEKFSSGSNDQKTNITNYCVNLGYNDLFGNHIALTPKFGYEWQTFKNSTTDVKTKYRGFQAGLGCSLHF